MVIDVQFLLLYVYTGYICCWENKAVIFDYCCLCCICMQVCNSNFKVSKMKNLNLLTFHVILNLYDFSSSVELKDLFYRMSRAAFHDNKEGL